MGGLRDLAETLQELAGWILKTLLRLFGWIWETLLGLFGWLAPRTLELVFLFFAFLWWRIDDLAGEGLFGPVTPLLLLSSAFLITWAILRMTRILGTREQGGV